MPTPNSATSLTINVEQEGGPFIVIKMSESHIQSLCS